MNDRDTAADGNSAPPAITTLLRRFVQTGLGALHNRGELLLVELQEEKTKALELLIWAGATCFLGMVFLMVFTATIILLFPEDLRVYVAGAFSLLYLLGALFAFLNLKSLARGASLPFAGTLDEARKDREWLESLE